MQVDEERMAQVLKNLLDYALRHTPPGGTIWIGAGANGAMHIWVQDSGEGIDAGDLPYVFDRFYRVDKPRSGNTGKMGLRLAICKALVEAQGGTISAESEGKDRGTKISMRLAP